MDWVKTLNQTERRAFYGAFLGHTVDVFDFIIYSFLISTLISLWHMDRATAGAIVTYTLLSSLVGAIGAGVLADRYGRVRVLRWTIILFAVSCFLCGISNSPGQLMVFRILQGLGFGGESSLCMVLVTETIRNPEHRGKYSGFTASSYSFGWGLAAVVYAAVFAVLPAATAWRACFFIGILPAAFVFYLRRNVAEPEVFEKSLERLERLEGRPSAGRFSRLGSVMSGPLLGKTMLCSILSGGMLGGYYAIATWLPTYLKTVRGLSIFGTSSYLAVMIVGSFVGYAAGAYAADRLGRRLTYILFAACAFAMALAYMMIPVSNNIMLILGFPLGVMMLGMFSGLAATISESYPNEVRATGYGVAYNVGRVIGSLFPLSVGWLSTGYLPLGLSIAVVAGVGYACVVLVAIVLPETKGLDFTTLRSAVPASTGEAAPEHAKLPADAALNVGRDRH